MRAKMGFWLVYLESGFLVVAYLTVANLVRLGISVRCCFQARSETLMFKKKKKSSRRKKIAVYLWTCLFLAVPKLSFLYLYFDDL